MTEAASMDWMGMILGLAGGLALFLFGMEALSDALKAAAGPRLKGLLARITRNRASAVAAGAGVTALIQSSSVTTVLLVGFVGAGLMSLQQSIAVIMGANIGTTVTAQLIAFDVGDLAMALSAAGFFGGMAARSETARHGFAAALGLGLLFIGMGLMSDAMRPLRSFQPFIDLMATMAHPLAGVAAGAAFTALVQSSSATNGVVIALATGGLVTLEAGVALALGANLGTCVTAWLAGVGRPAAARRVAAAHVAFNVVGVALWIGFLPELAALARAVSPEAHELDGFARLAAETPRQIANANTLFNVANTLALIGFSGVLARVLKRLIPEPPAPPPELALDRALLDTPAAALAVARRALRDMGARIETVIAALGAARLAGDAEAFRRLGALDDRLDRAQAELADYLASLRREAMGAEDVATAQTVLTAVTELEAVGDLLAERLPEIALRWRREGAAPPSVAAAAALDAAYEKVALAARLAAEAVAEDDAPLAWDAVAAADAADVAAHGLSALQAAHLADGPAALATLRLEAEIASTLRHAASHARRCALLATPWPMADGPTATAPTPGRETELA